MRLKEGVCLFPGLKFKTIQLERIEIILPPDPGAKLMVILLLNCIKYEKQDKIILNI